MKQFKINKNYTNRSEESLDKYLVEINRIPTITPDQEVELAQIIRKGGKKWEEAKNKLVTANLRFVVSVAKQYQHQGVPLSDLINEGNLGLITAANKFDETRGFKFISYAIWWIRQSILQSIADYSNMVRRPQSQIAISNKIKNATNVYFREWLEIMLLHKVLWPSAQGYGSKYNPYGVEILRHTIGSPWVDEGTTVTFAT